MKEILNFLKIFPYTITGIVFSSLMLGVAVDWRQGATVFVAGCLILMIAGLAVHLLKKFKKEE